MNINLDQEKNLNLTAQEIYDILDLAIQAAEDDGFISEYVYNRAICLYSVIALYPDLKKEIAKIISEHNPLFAWNYCLDKDYIQALFNEHQSTLDFLEEESKVWLKNYTAYLHSARGIIGTFQGLSADILSQASQRFQDVNNGSNVQEVIKIAENWGFENIANNTLANKPQSALQPDNLDSLYDTSVI